MNDSSSEIRKDDEENLAGLFKSHYGPIPTYVMPLPVSGGKRRYYRMRSGDMSVIGCVGTKKAENAAFVDLCRHLGKTGVHVPAIVTVSPDYMCYLQSDLGDISLADFLGTPEIEKMVIQTLDELVKMQTVPKALWEGDCEYGAFCRRQIMWDLNYFKYEYLKPAGVEFNEDLLEDDFERFAERLLAMSPQMEGFMMRDCQSRNVMICDGTPYFIDIQGGRPGPCVYDAVSLLWQAKARFSDEFRNDMTEYYSNKLGKTLNISPGTVKSAVPMYALFRTLQVLGAYGLRGLVERKQHFIDSIPYALANLKTLTERGAADEYPELRRISEIIV